MRSALGLWRIDLRRALRAQGGLWVLVVASFFVVALVGASKSDGNAPMPAGGLDLLIFANLGVPLPPDSPPRLPPMLWLFGHLLLGVLVTVYPASRPAGIDVQLVLRVGRRRWWLTRCVTMVLTVTCWWAVMVATAAIIGATSARRWGWGRSYEAMFNAVDITKVSVTTLVLGFVVAFLATLATAALQMLVSQLSSPIAGLVAFMAYLVASTSLASRGLPAAWAMLARTRLVDAKAVHPAPAICVLVAIVVVVIGVGSELARRGMVRLKTSSPDEN